MSGARNLTLMQASRWRRAARRQWLSRLVKTPNDDLCPHKYIASHSNDQIIVTPSSFVDHNLTFFLRVLDGFDMFVLIKSYFYLIGKNMLTQLIAFVQFA